MCSFESPHSDFCVCVSCSLERKRRYSQTLWLYFEKQQRIVEFEHLVGLSDLELCILGSFASVSHFHGSPTMLEASVFAIPAGFFVVVVVVVVVLF